MNSDIIIFTDLYGTRLDHNNFSFEQISDFFNYISQKTIIISNKKIISINGELEMKTYESFWI